MHANPLELSVLADLLTVCRLPAGSPFPAWARAGSSLLNLTVTPDEVSLVCRAADVPPGVRVEGPWRALKVAGPLDFALTGVLARLLAPLAAAGVSVFTVSTFDTDYVLVKADRLGDAITALRGDGHAVTL